MNTKSAARKKVPPLVSKLMAPPAANANNVLQLAREGTLSLDDLIKTADEWQKKTKTDEIDSLYSTWIENTESPYKFIACFNYGVLLANWGRDEEAIAVYVQAIQLNPTFAHPRINIGLAHERQGKSDAAIECWTQVITDPLIAAAAPDEIKTTALNHIGRLKEQLKDYAGAEQALTESLGINPNQGDALHHWFHLRQKQCKWPILDRLPLNITENQVIRSMSPLAALAHSDDPALQMYVGEKIVREKFTYQTEPLVDKKHRWRHSRLRVGYLSGDLCTHAVGLILPELFELHDRNRFEIFAFDYSKEDGTLLRHRYKQAIEHFIPIHHLNDNEAARKIREYEIDVLIDLHGLSLGLRAGILGQRPAPVQMTYLGYIGATMMPYVDYVISDKFCFKQELKAFYSERPLILDRCCIPTDRKKQIDPTPSREEIGLPANRFIFATFNNSYKLNEQMFESWVRILKRVTGSVLWIIDDNQWATRNLKDFVASRGLDPERLVFTPRVPTTKYLARMPLADLFLDNHPYNAGSTASDVLWMGTPMVTLAGRTFVSRMAASMLHHCGLDELIAHSHAEYEDLATRLANEPQQLANIRAHLLLQRAHNGAFDMEMFTRNFEAKLIDAYANENIIAD